MAVLVVGAIISLCSPPGLGMLHWWHSPCGLKSPGLARPVPYLASASCVLTTLRGMARYNSLLRSNYRDRLVDFEFFTDDKTKLMGQLSMPHFITGDVFRAMAKILSLNRFPASHPPEIRCHVSDGFFGKPP